MIRELIRLSDLFDLGERVRIHRLSKLRWFSRGDLDEIKRLYWKLRDKLTEEP